jgi:hypothetical protein
VLEHIIADMPKKPFNLKTRQRDPERAAIKARRYVSEDSIGGIRSRQKISVQKFNPWTVDRFMIPIAILIGLARSVA